jgi:hypothetical protein
LFVFRDETLRGLLLNAYAFGKVGQIAFWGAIASFTGAGLMLLLAIFGFLYCGGFFPKLRCSPGAAAVSGLGPSSGGPGLPGPGRPASSSRGTGEPDGRVRLKARCSVPGLEGRASSVPIARPAAL